MAEESQNNPSLHDLISQLKCKKIRKQIGLWRKAQIIYEIVKTGTMDDVNTLVDEGANVNDVNVLTEVLSAAAQWQRLDVMTYALDKGADVNAVNYWGVTALDSLLRPSVSNDKDKTKLTPREKECLDLLLSKGVDVNQKNKDGKTILILLASEGNTVGVRELIKLGADVNIKSSRGQTALEKSVFEGHQECMKLLIEAGALLNDPEAQFSPLTTAVMGARLERKQCVVELINAGADVNAADENGRTVLMVAMDCKYARRIRNRFNIVCLLLDKGVHVNKTNSAGLNSLQIHNLNSTPPDRKLSLLVLAAGETADSLVRTGIQVPEYLTNTELRLNLKHLCREAIRKHLIDLDTHQHLFGRIPKLGLPALVTEYLLFNMSLDMEWSGVDGEDGDK